MQVENNNKALTKVCNKDLKQKLSNTEKPQYKLETFKPKSCFATQISWGGEVDS